MNKSAKDLKKWDRIQFRRSNTRRWSNGLLCGDTEATTFAGLEFVTATIKVGKIRQLLNFGESLEWRYMGTLLVEELA